MISDVTENLVVLLFGQRDVRKPLRGPTLAAPGRPATDDTVVTRGDAKHPCRALGRRHFKDGLLNSTLRPHAGEESRVPTPATAASLGSRLQKGFERGPPWRVLELGLEVLQCLYQEELATELSFVLRGGVFDTLRLDDHGFTAHQTVRATRPRHRLPV